MSHSTSEKVILPLEVSAILAHRATLEEWKNRDKEASRLPIGSVVIEVDRGLSPEDLVRLDVQTLIKNGFASAFLVEDYAKADGRPLCQRIGGESAIADLPLLPMLLSELPISSTR